MSDNDRQDSLQQLVAYIEKQAKRYQSNLQTVLSAGEVEAVHDVRVASRRLAEPLRIAAGWLGRKRIQRASDLLNKTRRSMRKVRDLDVLLMSLCGDASPAGLDARDLARLEGELTRRRDRGVEKAQHICRRGASERAAGWVRRLSTDLADAMGDSGEEMLAERLRDLFVKSLRRVSQRDPREGEAIDLHDTRIFLKRLRYSAELRRDVCGQDRPELHRALVGMQDLLGAWNDQLSAVRMITKIARCPRNLAEDAGWSARLLDHCAHRLREAESLRTKALAEWGEFAAVLRFHEDREDSCEPAPRQDAPALNPA